MLECLVEHGCLDLTSAINQQATSSGWVTGGSFGDIYSGKLHNGTDIAIKVLRFANLTEDKRKSLKVCYQNYFFVFDAWLLSASVPCARSTAGQN